MKEETVRRTFNINNYESITFEGSAADENSKKALLLAEKDCLLKAQMAMVRIFSVRQQHGTINEFDGIAYSVVTSEIAGIDQKLETL